MLRTETHTSLQIRAALRPGQEATPVDGEVVRPSRSPTDRADSWSATRSWAGRLAMDAATASFRIGLIAPTVVDTMAGAAVDQFARAASIVPKVVCGVTGGIIALPLGLHFEHGVVAGSFVGTLASQNVIEGAYRLSILSAVGTAAVVSAGVGGTVGAAALTAGATMHAARKVYAATSKNA